MAAGVTAGLLAATVANPIDAITLLYDTSGWSVSLQDCVESLLHKTGKICVEKFSLQNRKNLGGGGGRCIWPRG